MTFILEILYVCFGVEVGTLDVGLSVVLKTVGLAWLELVSESWEFLKIEI